jgi:hypothetical protein
LKKGIMIATKDGRAKSGEPIDVVELGDRRERSAETEAKMAIQQSEQK